MSDSGYLQAATLAILTVIANGTHSGQALQFHPRFPSLSHLPNTPTLPLTISMSSLIEGWFQLTNGRPFVDNSTDTASSPRKTKSYLSTYDSCATLGPISSEVFVQCELRLFPGNHVLEDKIIHAHGRFSIIYTADEDQPHHLQIEVHRFVVMNMDPSDEDTPDDLYTSVTLSGRVVSAADVTDDTADKFFMLEISEYIRDRNQTFNIRFGIFFSILG